MLELLREVESDSLRIDVTQSLLYLGHKSLPLLRSHCQVPPVFKALADTEEAQICATGSTWDLWKYQQMLVVLIDKLLKTGVVECAAVANWVFSKEMVQEFGKVYTGRWSTSP